MAKKERLKPFILLILIFTWMHAVWSNSTSTQIDIKSSSNAICIKDLSEASEYDSFHTCTSTSDFHDHDSSEKERRHSRFSLYSARCGVYMNIKEDSLSGEERENRSKFMEVKFDFTFLKDILGTIESKDPFYYNLVKVYYDVILCSLSTRKLFKEAPIELSDEESVKEYDDIDFNISMLDPYTKGYIVGRFSPFSIFKKLQTTPDFLPNGFFKTMQFKDVYVPMPQRKLLSTKEAVAYFQEMLHNCICGRSRIKKTENAIMHIKTMHAQINENRIQVEARTNRDILTSKELLDALFVYILISNDDALLVKNALLLIKKVKFTSNNEYKSLSIYYQALLACTIRYPKHSQFLKDPGFMKTVKASKKKLFSETLITSELFAEHLLLFFTLENNLFLSALHFNGLIPIFSFTPIKKAGGPYLLKPFKYSYTHPVFSAVIKLIDPNTYPKHMDISSKNTIFHLVQLFSASKEISISISETMKASYKEIQERIKNMLSVRKANMSTHYYA
ncbi:hypothetical protein NEFER03_0309 [Nematocida sp. LUAm3]|nr:hypothetical protein NEFER03_0309 [Nematocida sp. LUAm3]KAI5173761.1 hypothetical protein NEFER02_0277 [Nematocida sp. LUAm2]KAI5176984.1 hypothetical protein NEFER01_0309 [Nematocida sp. LUAm1]